MPPSIALDKMTVLEKIGLMESLWDDLCRADPQPTSPDWHRDTLAKRQAAIDSGDATFSDWSAAKQRIRNATR